MANVKISELSAMAALDGTEVFPGVQGGTTEKATAAQLATYTETTLDQLEAGVRTTVDTSNPGFLSTDVDLATGISGGDTLTGGTGSAQTLTLASTSHATRGTIGLRDTTLLISEDKTHDTVAGAYAALSMPSTRTITFNHGTAGANQLQIFSIGPTVVYDVNSATFGYFLVNHASTLKNVNGETRTIQSTIGFRDVPTFTADGATVTFTGYTAFSSIPSFGVTNSGVASAGASTGFVVGLTVNTGATVTTRTGISFADSTGSGTVTTAVMIDIPTLSHAGLSIGLRNASTIVNTPTTATLTAAGDTIPITAAQIRLNNTSGGSLTLTSAPTMANGQNGQVITLINTSANNVVIQDQGTLASSNLRLTATGVTIGPRQSVQLTYNSTVGDWVQTGNLVAVL